MYPYGGEAGPKRIPGEMRPKEDTKEQAIDFLRQYYASLDSENSDDHKNRVAQVLSEIEETDTYHMTTNELNFGARMAWRNAPRCIGRIQWKKLTLFDCRHVSTAREMFECILEHIKYATNKGKLRSTISIFPHRSARKKDFRVWNGQLVRYAGYKQEDGTVIGDPASVELTEIAQQLGWVGKGTRFDVLPLILQANGELPELFVIPDEYVMEVNITHPVYKEIDKMNLKWYCIPAVANIALDCGGLEFTAAPFNGWYMATEIGARNFSDKDRYNLLKPVADSIGLDTSNNVTLWKDTALLELTKAVLHSFNSAGVTIADHHASSESFMKHLKNEQELRGGCPSDWVWIVPPLSGSATAVFHQEMLNYKLKPSYEYQADPWKYSPVTSEEKNKVKKTFKEVASAVRFTSDLFKNTLARRSKVTILYATETGKSEEYATMLNELFLHAFDSKMLCMDNYNFVDLENEQCLFIIASTFGNGEAPDNGKAFEEKLKKLVAGGKITHDKLTNVNYSVFALGSRAYPYFCAFGKDLSKHIKVLGGEEIFPTGEGDELNGQEESFKEWARGCFEVACKLFSVVDVKINTPSAIAIWKSVADWQEGLFQIVKAKENEKSVDILKGLSKLHRRKITTTKAISVENLQSPKSGRITDLVKLDSSNSEGIIYQPGDHLSVYPCNNKRLVQTLLELSRCDIDFDIPIYLQKKNNDGIWECADKFPLPSSLREIFTHYVDITTPPSTKLLALLKETCTDESEMKRLHQLVTNNDLYENWKYRQYPNICEVFAEFPSAQIDLTMLLNQLPVLKPRFYSISSSPDMSPNQVHLTVALVSYMIDKKTHYGVCSLYLHSLTKGDLVSCHIRTAPRFHLPSSPSVPIIMVGPGTGIAPFRGFWQQAIYDKKNDNKERNMFLLFGCRNSTMDNIYQNERDEVSKKGIFKKSLTAFSREPDVAKVSAALYLHLSSLLLIFHFISFLQLFG
ncbi:nitric oxide synthase, inducible-like isoform X1 [Hydractinia symbiolongicarpus]|uniref:nitric oxide synthase, inducible-like isoform X1 n=1 Tax=Hydractinia symbiolongicarpus TaxID=13093 RepID=UPI00254E8C76|nr:nitric oxide synthase, inducible-like isoform X1 [Hydractinia symbiolongicarpus]